MSTFQRARTSKQINERREEIINASKLLFRENGYENVTFNKIAMITSIKRSTIYTYYKTPDDIILEWLQIELTELIEKLINTDMTRKSKLQIAECIVTHFEAQIDILKICSHLFTLIENNCCEEHLLAFKRHIFSMYEELDIHFRKSFKNSSKTEVSNFTNAFLPVLVGIFQATNYTERQKKIMLILGKEDYFPKFREFAINTIYSLVPINE